MKFKLFTSNNGAPGELIDEVEFDFDTQLIGFCHRNWDGKGDRPPFEIQYPNGTFFQWGSEDEPDDDDDEPKPVKLSDEVSCQKCNSHRVADVSTKGSDLSFYSLGDREHDGYLPDGVGIGGGDYLEMTYCLDCGQIQGKWPLPISAFETREDEE